MVIIGAFTQHGDIFSGRIRTLTVDLPSVQIIPVSSGAPSGDSSAYRLVAGWIEIACGRRTRKGRTEHFTLTLDDPSFAKPIEAHMIRIGDSRHWALVWFR